MANVSPSNYLYTVLTDCDSSVDLPCSFRAWNAGICVLEHVHRSGISVATLHRDIVQLNWPLNPINGLSARFHLSSLTSASRTSFIPVIEENENLNASLYGQAMLLSITAIPKEEYTRRLLPDEHGR